MTSWRKLRDEAAGCTRCGLYERATQTVFGEGPVSAAIALVGEQPGDQEDKQGRPFPGRAGNQGLRALADRGARDRPSAAGGPARRGGAGNRGPR